VDCGEGVGGGHSTDETLKHNIWDDTNGFDFLGLHHRKFPVMIKGGSKVYVVSHIPSKKAMKKMK
jgi:RNA-directed DNA polymerase